MKKKISVLFLLRVIKLGVSLLNLSLAAKYFGVTLQRDVWLLALNCLVVIDFALWGPVNETFRAKFVLLKETAGGKDVVAQVRSLITVIFSVSTLITVGLLLFPGLAAAVIAPGYIGEEREALMLMIRVVAPSLLLNQLTLLGISILNAYESFYVPEVSGFIAAIVNLLCLAVLAPVIGIYALAVAYYFGLLLLAVLLIVQLHKKNIPLFSGYRSVRLRASYPFFRYALPFFLPYFFAQLNLLIEKALASILGNGTVSIVDYARKFVDIPIHVLTSVLLTMLVPALSARFARGDQEGFGQEFRQILRFGILVVSLLIAFFSSSAYPVISVILFHKEQMPAEAVAEISLLSQYYAWSALINFFYIIFGLALLSTGKGKYYAFFGVVAQLVMITLNMLFYRTWGAYVFPVSFILAHALAAVFLFLYFPGSRRRLVPDIARYVLVLAVTAAMAWYAGYLSPVLVGNNVSNTISNYVIIAVNTSFILLLLLTLLYIFRLDERLIINRFVLKLIRRIM